MKPIFGTFLALGMVLQIHETQAQDKSEDDSGTAHKTASQLNEDGVRFFQSRDYRRAIEAFIDAYALNADPNLQFNIARSYEKLGDTDAAIRKYGAFLELPGADTNGRVRAQESIQALKKLKVASQTRELPEPMDVDFTIPEPHSSAFAEQDESSVVPWLGVISGAAFMTAGVFLCISGADDIEKVAESKSKSGPLYLMTRSEAQDLIDSGNTKKAIGVSSVAVGVALLTISFIVLSSDSGNSDVELKVGTSGHGPSLLLDGSF
jgi:tetratricopeptide (TPR) repeat protein